MKHFHLRRSAINGIRQVYGQGHCAVGRKTRINRPQPQKALQHQTRARQQDERKGYFGDRQNAAYPFVACRHAAAAWAKNRLATFAQATSSTNATAPAKTRSDGRISATNRSFSGIICGNRSLLLSPGSKGRRSVKASSSACAWLGETPAFNRPTTGRVKELCGSMRMASSIHALAPGKAKPGGITPMTTWPTPSSWIIFPRIPGS